MRARKGLRSVRSLSDRCWRWRAAGPVGVEVEWDAKIVDERIDEFLAWRSMGNVTVTNSGEVEFGPAPGGRGTEIRVRLVYDPPAGKLGAAVAKLFSEAPEQQTRDDLRRFKQVLETGEVVRSEGSPQGTKARQQILQRPASPPPADPARRSEHRRCEPSPGWARTTSKSRTFPTRRS